jgi:hypothetical protein
MESITKRTLLISANSALIVLTSQMVFFVLDMFKDEGAKQCIANDYYLNIGISICLFCLPVLAFITFLFFKFKGEPKAGSISEKFTNKIIIFNTLVNLFNISGLLLILMPFYSSIAVNKPSFSLFSVVGFLVAVVLFKFFEKKLINSIKR